MPDNTIRNDIQKAMAKRSPLVDASTAKALTVRKQLANQIAKRNAGYTPLGQAAKGSLWRSPDRPVGPLIKRITPKTI